LVVWLVYIIPIDFTVRTYPLWLGLLIARYLVMLVQLKHLPHLPLARELLISLQAIWTLFVAKTKNSTRKY
jgi:hypothetical protein